MMKLTPKVPLILLMASPLLYLLSIGIGYNVDDSLGLGFMSATGLAGLSYLSFFAGLVTLAIYCTQRGQRRRVHRGKG